MNKRQARFDALQKEMRLCRICLLAGYFVQPPAVTKGSLGAKIMTIGQAPGITEVEAGRPFNAGSGRRLFQWLAEAGIEEDWFPQDSIYDRGNQMLSRQGEEWKW